MVVNGAGVHAPAMSPPISLLDRRRQAADRGLGVIALQSTGPVLSTGRSLSVSIALWTLLAVAVAGWGAAAMLAKSAAQASRTSGRLAALAGLTPVSGPGIEVVLKDASGTSKPGTNPNVGLIQDQDLLVLTMMLWYGGARAIDINGERIVAQTTITSSGPTILVNSRRLVGPFVVRAVGAPAVLRGSLEAHGGFVERMREMGLPVTVTTRQSIKIPAWNPEGVPVG